MIAKTVSGPSSTSSSVIEGWDIPADPDTMPIAVIGMACRFSGGAETPAKLWDMLAQGRSGWSPIKQSRFHGEAWYHPDKGHVGTTNVKGAHFIEEDIALFDASFFSFSSDISSTMDPEVRLQLETSYEALENAGLPLESVAGTKTGVFAGTSFRDNHDNHMRDPGTMNDAFFVTGNGAAMIANRVSHFYDLRGPSVMVDTGCSTSLTLLHLACQSLRTGECETALVGGSALLINPEMFIAGTKLGIFSPQGKSFAFDHRADGYGRGDGIASIVLKPLSAALRDGDSIRAVIRNTAVNQDGKTTTITSPSPEAQMALMKSCYAAARLDPLDTGYVEAHGTGTQTGDVIEGNAIGTVFGKDRSRNSPLVIGSVKTNIGHTEATSGLAAVIKVVLALEHGRIPPQMNFEKANPALDLDGLNMKVPVVLEHWPAHSLRRASVNNFGYGGANAHAIIEHPDYLLGVPSPSVSLDPAGRSRVLTWSAKDQRTVEAMGTRLLEYFTEGAGAYGDEDAVLDRLAYTLGDRRTRFPWSMTCAASSRESLIEALNGKAKAARRRPAKAPRLGFVFTGQGAQWHAMGRELISLYPVFRNSLLRSDKFLAILGSPWSLLDELSRDEENSRVNEVAYSLPLSVAVQVALIDLLRSWNINPTGVTGHSSGEVSAAYAAGLISHQAALAIVYCRGDLTRKATEMLGHSGGMCAVGLGREDAMKYIDQVTEGELTVACVNSPVSVTVSGDRTGLDQLEALLAADKVFARRLKVNAAYHSHHMQPIAEPYGEALARWVKPLPESDDSIIFSSPTTGRRAEAKTVAQPDHWVRNMTQPVEFVDCLRNMCLDYEAPETEEPPLCVDFLVEVGAHGALGGPIRQTLSLPELKDHSIAYASCLTRKENAITTMQNLAATLIQHGYPVDLNAVNFPRGRPEGLRILTDLPPYPWNHTIRYWREPRLSQAARERTVPPHDLLGRPTADFSPLTPTWRHLLRLRDLPWLRDHVIQGSIIFPGAGYLCMALEAMRQIVSSSHGLGPVSGYQLENIDIQRALVIEDNNDDSVEVRVSLRPSADPVNMGMGWYDFHIQSLHAAAGKWIVHCEGRIMAVRREGQLFGGAERPVHVIEAKDAESWEGISGPETYASLSDVGLTYGSLFQNQVGTKFGDGSARSIISVPDTAAVMPYNHQQPHLVHPTTLDTCFQAMFHALPPLQAGRSRSAMVPKTIRSIHVAADMLSSPGHKFAQTSRLNFARGQGFETSATISDEDSTEPVLTILGLFCQSVGAAASAVTADEDRLCFKSIWKPDVERLRMQDITEDSSIWLDILVRLVCHKRPAADVLEIGAGAASGKNTRRILTALGAVRHAISGGRFDVTNADSEKLASLQEIETSETVAFKALDLAGDLAEQGFEGAAYNLAVLSSALEADQVQNLTRLRGLVKDGGHLIVSGDISRFDLESAGWTNVEQALDGKITLARASQAQETEATPPVAIVASDLAAATLEALQKGLQLTLKTSVTACNLADETATALPSDTVVIFIESSTEGILSQPTAQEYTRLQNLLLQSPAFLWISSGAQIDSENPFSALHTGLLRTLDLENQGTKYASLDLESSSDLTDDATTSHIAQTLRDILSDADAHPRETEYAIRNNIRHISRVHEDHAQNNLVAAGVNRQQPELRPFKTPGTDLRLISTAPGLLQNLTFVEDDRPSQPLPDDWVEVQPAAYGLNFRDLMIALDQLNETRMGYECAGTLTKVTPGAEAQGWKVGDRVFLVSVNCFCSTLRLHYDGLARLPEWLDFEQGASLAMVHTTAYHCLYEVARLEKGESILIHSGSGGVGQAAIMMAKNIGAEIFVTVGSDSKRTFIQETYGIPASHIFNSHDATFAAGIMAATDGQGVDVVLNSLAGPLLRATWSCVAPFGRFVEIGKRDIEQGHGLSMAPFAKCLAFTAVDLLAMFDKRPRQFFNLLRQVSKMVDAKEIGPVGPILPYSMGNLEGAFRIMQEGKHMGKIVLRPVEGDMVKVLPVPTTLSLHAESTYLLVGGLGGIGASIARRLASRGARNLVLMSRSAASPTEEQKAVVQELEESGVRVYLRSCDVANREQLATVLAELPPINGVIQAAMVLRDGIFETMTHEKYTTTVRAKVQGTWNLHTLLPSDLSFFIMLASISGAGGNAGQANYSAGNAFQDALARHRSANGLSGIAIDLGAVKAVGVLAEAENAATAARLARVGLRPLEEDEVLRLVETAIQRPIRETSDAQIITGIPAKFVRSSQVSNTFWNRSARFVTLEHADASAANSTDAAAAAVGSPAHTRALLANCTSRAEARAAITSVLVTKLAGEFGRPESDIEPSLALTEIGVDSLIAVELRNWIAATLDADCSIFDVMQSPSLSILVDKLVGKSRLVKTE